MGYDRLCIMCNKGEIWIRGSQISSPYSSNQPRNAMFAVHLEVLRSLKVLFQVMSADSEAENAICLRKKKSNRDVLKNEKRKIRRYHGLEHGRGELGPMSVLISRESLTCLQMQRLSHFSKLELCTIKSKFSRLRTCLKT